MDSKGSITWTGILAIIDGHSVLTAAIFRALAPANHVRPGTDAH